MLKIFQTANLVNAEYQKNLNQNGFLEKILTFEDLKKRAVLLKNRIEIDNDTRILLLREAADFKDFKKLHLSLDFISFLQNSSLIFSFFEEIANELVNFDSLKTADAYAEYSERIEVLEKLKERYEKILDKKGYVDSILIPKIYTLNYYFLKSFKKIIFYQIDYINAFETKLLEEISKIVPLHIKFKIDSNNKAIAKHYKLKEEFEDNFYYTIDLTNKEIIEKEPLKNESFFIEHFASSNNVSQISYVKKKVYDFLNEGIEADKIAVISNNNDFFKLLYIFDEEGNFDLNSFDFENFHIYKKLEAIYRYLTEKNYENIHRLKRLKVDREKIEKDFLPLWEEKIKKEDFIKLFENIKGEDSLENQSFKEEFSNFIKIFHHLKEYPLNKIFHFLLNRLKNIKIKDNRGGKIKVYRVNEAKGMEFDAIIVCDFNESQIFQNPFNDLFLSSAIRARTKMLTPKEYRDIQKHHIINLFKKSKKNTLCYIENDQNAPARFLFELQSTKSNFNEESLNEIIFTSNKLKQKMAEDRIEKDYDFRKTLLSPLKLKTFLDCKRKYYLKYIAKLEDFQIPTDKMDERQIGIFLHEGLYRLYDKYKSFENEKELLEKLKDILYEMVENQIVLKASTDVWIKKLHKFALKEIERLKEGFTPKFLEFETTGTYKGFSFKGKIDRIDEKNKKYYIIDYKSGTIPKTSKKSLIKTTDFQLQIYYRILEDKLPIENLFYFDIENGTLLEDDFFDEKLNLLDEKLKLLEEKRINFSKTQDLSKCRYCPYTILCER